MLGDMIYLNVLGQHFVILNSLEDITNLFEKRSSNYSDRIQTTMLSELYVFTFTSKNFSKLLFFQNELEDKHVKNAIRLVVAKTQEIISPVFPP